MIKAGTLKMHKLFADSWDSQYMVGFIKSSIYSWFMHVLPCVGALPEYGCFTESQLSFGITDLNCTGSEENILNCSHSNASLHNCWSHSDASVVCQSMYIELIMLQSTPYNRNCTAS